MESQRDISLGTYQLSFVVAVGSCRKKEQYKSNLLYYNRRIRIANLRQTEWIKVK